jgi:carboxyl-terminal processing protease
MVAPAAPACAAPFTAAGTFDQGLVAQTVATALAFMAPRTLEPVSVPQMAIWGLHGLTAIDPRFAIMLQGEGKSATLRLVLGGQEVLATPAPPPDDAAAWGDAAAAAMRAAWDVSETLRQAGQPRMIDSLFDELLSHLDPYSRYAPPEEAAAERRRRAGTAGAGMTVAARGGVIVVAEVAAGGPAEQAGIRPGDRVLAIDGEPSRGADSDAVSARLAGPERTLVELTLRGRDGRSRTVTLERARVPPETVAATRQGDMLVLRISGFSRNTGGRLAQELIRGLADPAPPRGVVVDLRDNRGGVLQQAVDAAALLQGSGVVAVTAGRDPVAAHVFIAEGRDLAHFRPVVVLVDGDTASAAEIMAAALADERRAVVVGSSTLGKGLVQTIATLPDGGELLLSWSRVLAPLGWPLQDLGVLPQVCTSLGAAALDGELRALAHGEQPMRAALAAERAARAPVDPAQVAELRAACPPAGRQDADLVAARFLIDTPEAYAAALLPKAAGMSVPQNLTPPAAPRN